MSEHIPGSMTDEQALEILKSMKLTIGRGSSKTMFQQGLLEAICHAVVALEDKVENKGEWIFKDLHNGKTWYECSVCGRKIHVGDKAQLSDFPFCHCGADMRGEE